MQQEKKHSWGNSNPYNDYSSFIKKKFPFRVQKISVNGGFSCPNRDGTTGRGGCTYCNNYTFHPDYCKAGKNVEQQLNEGINFFKERYKAQKYLAYFQAYTNTYADIEHLKKLYTDALKHPLVIGLVVATRPDCINNQIIELLKSLSEKYYIVLEFGIESTHNPTLKHINRGHTFEASQNAIQLAANAGLHTGGHIILGLPNENREIMLSHAKKLSDLPLQTLKLHHLQINKATVMEKQYAKLPNDFQLFTPQSYLSLVVEFLELLSPAIVVERFLSESPRQLLIAPRWNGPKNFEFVERVKKELSKQNTWQGKNYGKTKTVF